MVSTLNSFPFNIFPLKIILILPYLKQLWTELTQSQCGHCHQKLQQLKKIDVISILIVWFYCVSTLIYVILTILWSSISATVRKPDELTRANLTDFGKYVAQCLPKFVQKVQLTAGDELEILISPEGILPTLSFLKDHHSAQFASLVDIAGMDVPSRKYRFEVSLMTNKRNMPLQF